MRCHGTGNLVPEPFLSKKKRIVKVTCPTCGKEVTGKKKVIVIAGRRIAKYRLVSHNFERRIGMFPVPESKGHMY